MSQHFVLNSVDLGTDVIRLGQIPGWITRAELGSAGMCGVPLDDLTGTLATTGWKPFVVTEDACASGNQRLFTGYVADRQITRRNSSSLITGGARSIQLNVTDQNAVLSMRLFPPTDTAANRASETDLARIAWLLSTAYTGGSVSNLGLVSSSGAITMDATDYRGQSAMSLLNDCASASGKNFFVYFKESAGALGLFYDFDYSTVYDSAVSFSNVLADVDNSTVFVLGDDWQLTIDPSLIYSGAQVPFSGTGSPVYVTLSSTAANFIARDTTAPNVNTKSSATAHASGVRYLKSIATEDQKITGTVRLPAAHVNDVLAGQRVQVKCTYMAEAGIDSAFVYLRVLSREVKQDELSDEFYNVYYELTPPVEPASGCTYVAPPIEAGARTSVDAFGGSRSGGTFLYNAAASVYPSTASILQGASGSGTQPLILYGTANNGTAWGIRTGVDGFGPRNEIRWTWDLGAPTAMCEFCLDGASADDAPYCTIDGSNDNASWTTVVSNAAYIAANGQPASTGSSTAYRYWSIHYFQDPTPSGGSYFSGMDFQGFNLWAKL